VVHQGEGKDSDGTTDEAREHAMTDRPTDQSDRPHKKHQQSDAPLPSTAVAESNMNAGQLGQ